MHIEYSLAGPYDFSCDYPLMSDLIRLCYPEREHENCRSIEEWFQASLDGDDFQPLRRLYEQLMKSDYHLVQRLIQNAERQTSSYGRFFEMYPDADFVTFNYDSFVELSLFKMRRWAPVDGYGVPVLAAQIPMAPNRGVLRTSKSVVLHLHGSLCIYDSSFRISEPDAAGTNWLQQKPQSDYLFDPDSLGGLFLPWRRYSEAHQGPAPIEARVIAPVPNKAEGLRRDFLTKVRSQAERRIQKADAVVAIGYNFNPSDAGSFEPLLSAVARRADPTLTVVTPSALETTERLGKFYDGIHFHPVPLSFSQWAVAHCESQNGTIPAG